MICCLLALAGCGARGQALTDETFPANAAVDAVTETAPTETEPETEVTTAATETEETGVPTEEETTEPAEAQDYVVNTNSGKFHYPDCGAAKRIKDSNRAERHCTREELVEQGYVPCGKCKP